MSTLIIFNKQKKSGVSYLTNQNVIRKFVFDSKKYKLIKNEIKGFEWYQSRYQNVYKSSEKIIRKERICFLLIQLKRLVLNTFLFRIN